MQTNPSHPQGNNSQRTSDRRRLNRYFTKARALVTYQDLTEFELEAKVRDISLGGVGLVMDVPLEAGEQITITLFNDIQHFQKQTHGVVRHTTLREDGTYLIGVELSRRLIPMDVQLLCQELPPR